MLCINCFEEFLLDFNTNLLEQGDILPHIMAAVRSLQKHFTDREILHHVQAKDTDTPLAIYLRVQNCMLLVDKRTEGYVMVKDCSPLSANDIDVLKEGLSHWI
jgi:hypothetical protein